MAATLEQRPIGELFADLAHDTATLVRHEVQLATVEMTEKAKVAGRNAVQVGIGGAVAMIGALTLTAALILILALAIPLWASALLVGLAVSGTGAALVAHGVNGLKRIDPAPRTTLQTLREDKQWLRAQMSR